MSKVIPVVADAAPAVHRINIVRIYIAPTGGCFIPFSVGNEPGVLGSDGQGLGAAAPWTGLGAVGA